MAVNEITAKICDAYKAAASWSAENPVLLAGQVGRESDTGRSKTGNGTTAWNNLAYNKAERLATARTISLTGDVTGSVSFDGSSNVSIDATVKDDSHNHIISNVDGLEDTLDSMATKNYVSSRGQNLVTNGSGLLGNNYNFSPLTYDGSEAYYSVGSFKYTGKRLGAFTDEFMPLNPNLRYKFEFFAKTQNASARHYTFVDFYDVDNKAISASYHMYKANTLTTLAQDLKNGDTVVYLTDASNWYNDGTAGVNTHLRSFIFWNYTNSYGYTYPALTYSRNWYGNAWNPDAIDFTTNTITLRVPWAGGTFTAGTEVSNGSSGATYKYAPLSNTLVPTEWTYYKGIYTGVDLTGTNASCKFPPGTAKARLGGLLSYTGDADTIWFANMSFGEDYASASHTHTKSNITDFPSSMPASDVYAWAKAASKPSYTFSEIGSKPTTLSGYGITDAASSSHTHGNITNDGKIGSNTAADQFVITTTNGSLTTANASTALSKLGISVTATQLNYVSGVTSNIQTQLDNKASLNYVGGVTSNIQTQLNNKAPLASPVFTGTPTAPTPTAGDNSTRIATTAFVKNAVDNISSSGGEIGFASYTALDGGQGTLNVDLTNSHAYVNCFYDFDGYFNINITAIPAGKKRLLIIKASNLLGGSITKPSLIYKGDNITLAEGLLCYEITRTPSENLVIVKKSSYTI